MTVEKGHICRDLEKIKPGGFAVMGIIVTAVIAVVIAAVLEQDNTEIDPQKDVYLFLHGRADLQEKAEAALVAYGFQEDKITVASSENIGRVGDYIAMLWRPPRPDHIKIQKITRVDEVEPDKIIGLWRGVSGKDIDTVSLEAEGTDPNVPFGTGGGSKNQAIPKYIKMIMPSQIPNPDKLEITNYLSAPACACPHADRCGTHRQASAK